MAFNIFISFAIVLIVLSIVLISFCIFDKITLGQVFASILLYIYMFSVLSSVLFTRRFGVSSKYELMLFWSYLKIIKNHDIGLLIQVLLNCVMLLPIGFLLPLSISSDLSWIWCFIICLIFSVSIEVSQLIFKLGLFEFDDILHNVIGGMLGFFISKFIINIFAKDDEY